MSLSKIDKKHLNELILSLNNENQNKLEIIKSNHSNYGKLKMISEQINRLKMDALNLINDSIKQNELQNLNTTFKLVSGTNYYLYENNEKKYFSIIGPNEWNNKDRFISKFYYDYDKQFIKIDE
tara:strand:+ start:104 stop:475 length:372 start_codon:yes stop_codon:yes gene_type:complete